MWKLSSDLWFLTSQGTSASSNYLYSFHFSGVTNSISYVISRLSIHWDSLYSANTIILFNASAESLAKLADWPSQYSEVCPFTVQELTAINLPFAILKRGNNGLIRAIIITNTDSEITAFLSVMKDQQVPVGIPWTLENGAVTQAINISPTPPTTTPPPIVTSNTCQLSGTLYFLNSQGISGRSIYEYIKSFYSNVGGLGSG
jgi:hypothetical protein